MTEFPNIKSIHGVTPVTRPEAGRAVAGKNEAYPMIEKPTPTDVVRISADAVLKSKLSAFNATLSDEINTISPERMSRLKREYAGDNCPVSSYDVAGAIIERITLEGKIDE